MGTESFYRSFVLVAVILLAVLLTAQLFYTVNNVCVKLSHGGVRDSGIYPKRARNVNAWYTPPPSNNAVETAYPMYYGSGGQTSDTSQAAVLQTGAPRRIVLARTTACPIFRSQDNGSVDPPFIG